MDEQFARKKIALLILISFVVLISLIIIVNILQRSSQKKEEPSPTGILRTSPPQKPIAVPQSIRNAPTFPPEKGKGVDIESEFIKTSTAEVQKLYPALPYLRDYNVSTGLTVSIVIPAKDLQENTWSLTVQVFGIDYQVPENSQDYQIMKASFREAANAVFEWMKSNGVNPQKTIIRWGDKAFIKQQAEEWLQ